MRCFMKRNLLFILTQNIFLPNLNYKATLKEVKFFKETRGWMSVVKAEPYLVFRTQSSISDGAFLQK